MIIESDHMFGNNLVQRLTNETWQILFADRLSDAKKIVKRKNIDVVVLGLNAMKREGLAILKMIKKIRPFTEVIIINSSEQIALSIEGMKLGAFDDFMVPFDIDSLRIRIQDAWQQKKQKETAKKSLLDRYRDIMIAATFAEAGESDMAIEFLAKRKKARTKTNTKGD
uniref:Response regulator n=1 Tax=Candidatus Desulfatibia profunda TaxID=2841695 RepID=A0A8J6NV00_9BACT|nr:response regulator [Candidatus Desulfatibia profunda]